MRLVSSMVCKLSTDTGMECKRLSLAIRCGALRLALARNWDAHLPTPSLSVQCTGISPEEELGLSGDLEQAEPPSAASTMEGHPSLRVASLTKSSASSGCAAVSSPKLCVTYTACTRSEHAALR